MWDDPQQAAEWARFTIELGLRLFPRAAKLMDFNKNPRLKSDPFLLYDAEFLVEQYRAESLIAADVPYSELVDFLRTPFSLIRLGIIRGQFELQAGDDAWTSISRAGFKALRNSGRIGANGPMIRLRSVSLENAIVVLKIQRATYHDQARSNLILDWPTGIRPEPLTLRALLKAKYGEHLPELDDKRLANTVGVACLLFYREGGRFVPYLVRRVEKVGVYPGGIHCTASGAANWPDSSGRSFENFFLRAIRQEIDEEVGLQPEDLVDLRAVSLCRDFLRGGKPQMFFAGVTHLSRAQLKEKRITAVDTVKKLNGWAEVERDTWLRSSDVVMSPRVLEAKIKNVGVTLEAMAAFFHGQRYVAKYGRQFIGR